MKPYSVFSDRVFFLQYRNFGIDAIGGGDVLPAIVNALFITRFNYLERMPAHVWAAQLLTMR